jgi:U3 small nucleolar ribonucleoprotein protein IMP4
MKCNKSVCFVITTAFFFFLVYQIKLGTIDQLDACDTEWQYRPFMNTTKKRQFLTDEKL